MSVAKGNLNQLVHGFAGPAALAPRFFVAVTLNNLASQRVLISAIGYNVLFQNVADYANGIPVLSVQRNVTVNAGANVITGENLEEMVCRWDLDFRVAGRNPTFDVISFPRPIPLDPGYPYAVVLDVVPFGAFAAGVQLQLTVFGDQVPADGQQPFPLTLR